MKKFLVGLVASVLPLAVYGAWWCNDDTGGGGTAGTLGQTLALGTDAGDLPAHDFDWVGIGNESDESNFSNFTNAGAHLFLKENIADYSIDPNMLVGTSEEFPDVLIYGGDAKIMMVSTNEGDHGSMIDFVNVVTGTNTLHPKWAFGMHSENHAANPGGMFMKFIAVTGGVASVGADTIAWTTNGRCAFSGGLDLDGADNQFGQFFQVAQRVATAPHVPTGNNTVAMFQDAEPVVAIMGRFGSSNQVRGSMLALGIAPEAAASNSLNISDWWQLEHLGAGSEHAFAISHRARPWQAHDYNTNIASDWALTDGNPDYWLMINTNQGVIISNNLTVTGQIGTDPTKAGKLDIRSDSTNILVHLQSTNDVNVRLANTGSEMQLGLRNGEYPALQWGLSTNVSPNLAAYTPIRVWHSYQTATIDAPDDNAVLTAPSNYNNGTEFTALDGYRYELTWNVFMSDSTNGIEAEVAITSQNAPLIIKSSIAPQVAAAANTSFGYFQDAATTNSVEAFLEHVATGVIPYNDAVTFTAFYNATNGNDTIRFLWRERNGGILADTLPRMYLGSHINADVLGPHGQ